jgi:hypothetical protein
MRNSLAARGVKIGIASVKLAAKAVGGAVELIVSGFDEDVEQEFEEDMERESEKIEYVAENLEEEAEEYNDQVREVNRIERRLRDRVDELAYFDLSVDEDGIDVNYND